MFSTKFISASKEYSTLTKMVSAPYLRRTFIVTEEMEVASLTICGLGFYELYLNGERITKGHLAPYISNPDDILYYDCYDLSMKLREGKNVIGVILGNGMLNCPGGQVWSFDKARWRSAPKLALSFEGKYSDGRKLVFEADENFVCADSPIYYDDLRVGEFYDARKEIEGWNLPEFDDSNWVPAIVTECPRGECRIVEAEPIVITEWLAPKKIWHASIGKQPVVHRALPQVEYDDIEADTEGWMFDFGVNTAGLCRLKIRGEKGQKIVLQFGELLDENNNLDMRGMNYLPLARNHRDIYICRGGEEEIWMPSFTYHGFRYCLVIGLREEQATSDLLSYAVMHSDIKSVGDFHCSDEMLNKIQAATRNADLANFYYIPTDCPHREKNAWTADAALSAEQMLLNFMPEKSYGEWLRNIRKAQREDGALPGIIPTAGWGYAWGNGPAWDCVAVYLPYYVWRYRGDTDIIRDNVHMIIRYINYITTRRDADGLIHIGLGDWKQPAHEGSPTAPLKLTDTIMCMDICHKAMVLFSAIGMEAQRTFAENVYHEFRTAARKYLIDHHTKTALGNCQTSQAMAIFFDVFEEGEKTEAFRVLLKMIEKNDGLMNVGVWGARVLFRVLSQFGRTDLAYKMITDGRYPSYAQWIKNGATALCEKFSMNADAPESMNHHFWGDVSGWMIEYLAGIVINPESKNHTTICIYPRFIDALNNVSAYHDTPAGKIESSWQRKGEDIFLSVTIPDDYVGDIRMEASWMFEDGTGVKTAKTGTYRLIKRGKNLI